MHNEFSDITVSESIFPESNSTHFTGLDTDQLF